MAGTRSESTMIEGTVAGETMVEGIVTRYSVISSATLGIFW